MKDIQVEGRRYKGEGTGTSGEGAMVGPDCQFEGSRMTTETNLWHFCEGLSGLS